MAIFSFPLQSHAFDDVAVSLRIRLLTYLLTAGEETPRPPTRAPLGVTVPKLSDLARLTDVLARVWLVGDLQFGYVASYSVHYLVRSETHRMHVVRS